VYYKIKEKNNEITKNMEEFTSDLVNSLNNEYREIKSNESDHDMNYNSMGNMDNLGNIGNMDNLDDLVTENNYFAHHLNYHDNYTVKMLGKIMDYYGLNKRKLKKDEIIENILLYESEICNIEIIKRRKMLWFYVSELKNDDFFKQYILVDI
tara:strand:- start:92 stop:547 length:456 start_codon:yes stop_codon:yes gene_type:complete